MNNFDSTLLSFLQQHNIAFDYYEHRPIFTVEEGEDIKHMIPSMHTKNLFLTDKRGQYFLVCVESSKRLPINQFCKLIGVKDLSFSTPEEMKAVLNLTPGSVSLFGLINLIANPPSCGHLPWQGGQQLYLYLDKDLREAKKVWRHPNRNDATIMIDHINLEKFLDAIGIVAKKVEIWDELKVYE